MTRSKNTPARVRVNASPPTYHDDKRGVTVIAMASVNLFGEPTDDEPRLHIVEQTDQNGVWSIPTVYVEALKRAHAEVAKAQADIIGYLRRHEQPVPWPFDGYDPTLVVTQDVVVNGVTLTLPTLSLAAVPAEAEVVAEKTSLLGLVEVDEAPKKEPLAKRFAKLSPSALRADAEATTDGLPKVDEP